MDFGEKVERDHSGRVFELAQRGSSLTRTALLFYLGMTGIAFLWRAVWQAEPMLFTTDVERQIGVHFWRDGAVGLALGLLVVGLSQIWTEKTRWGQGLALRLSEMVGGLSRSQCLILAVASGVGEEFFFRGALQPVVGLLLASALFGGMHFGPGREWLPWTGFAVIMGLGFGLLYEMTGNLWAPIVAHSVINGINLPRVVRLHAEVSFDSAPEG